MGEGMNKQLFVHSLKDILKVRGGKVENQELCEFLEFVHLLLDNLEVMVLRKGNSSCFSF